MSYSVIKLWLQFISYSVISYKFIHELFSPVGTYLVYVRPKHYIKSKSIPDIYKICPYRGELSIINS